MFAKKNRFSFKGELPRKVFHSNSFTVRYGKSADDLRVAVVVSKKVDNRATVRNKIKRRLIDIVEKSINRDKPFSLVFYIKKQVVASPNLNKEVSEAINNITI